MCKQSRERSNLSLVKLLLSRYITALCDANTTKKGRLGGKRQFHVFVAWIMELGGQIKVRLNICGVILPP